MCHHENMLVRLRLAGCLNSESNKDGRRISDGDRVQEFIVMPTSLAESGSNKMGIPEGFLSLFGTDIAVSLDEAVVRIIGTTTTATDNTAYVRLKEPLADHVWATRGTE